MNLNKSIKFVGMMCICGMFTVAGPQAAFAGLVGTVMIDKIKRTKNSIKQLFIPGMLFENMGITYLGPVDGHNIQALCKVLREAQKLDHAVLVHVITKKGKGDNILCKEFNS